MKLGEVFMSLLDPMLKDKGFTYHYDYPSICIELDADRLVYLELHDRLVRDNFNTIICTLASKTKGILIKREYAFADVFEQNSTDNGYCKLEKYISKDRNTASWYGNPTEEDVKALQTVVFTCLKTWM